MRPLTVIQGVRVPMSDGLELALDIYLPVGGDNQEPVPVVLERTPYGKQSLQLHGELYARHGIAYVAQDVRGRGESDGTFRHLLNIPDEGSDGAATWAWVRRQPWCNGMLGTEGASFSAANQQALAILHPAGLIAQVLFDSGANYRDGMFWWGGALNLGALLPACLMFGATSPSTTPGASTALTACLRSWGSEVGKQPLTPGLPVLSRSSEAEELYYLIADTPEDDPLWHNPGVRLEGRWDDYPTDVSLLMVSGWFATHVAANFKKYRELSRRSQHAVRLIVGPWTHSAGLLEATHAGEVEFGPESARFGTATDLRLKWFEHWFDMDDGTDAQTGVSIFIMGSGDGHRTDDNRLYHGGYWRDTIAWPLAGTRATPFYLEKGRQLTPSRPGTRSGSSTYLYDPHDPFPSIGGWIPDYGATDTLLVGPYDQRCRASLAPCAASSMPLCERPDVLTFETPDLAGDLEVVGPVEAVIWASTSAVDTDFFLRLIDVYPPSADFPLGFSLVVSMGVVRLGYRSRQAKAELGNPGQDYELRIEMLPTGNLFKKGHRIQLQISSSLFPHFQPNPNTGAPTSSQSSAIVATQTIHHNARHPSRVMIPIDPPTRAKDTHD